MDKAIEVKRRAQRCILNGDLDGALQEYQKLVSAPDPDPYHSVLLADLLYKKGDHGAAAEHYFNAVEGYQQASLFKNAIAVCKKMSRLSLAPARVLRKLAELHQLEGLPTEASLYAMQHAELLVRAESFDDAVEALRFGFEVCPDNLKTLERIAEVLLLSERTEEAAKTLLDAADRYNRAGQFADGVRCQDRAETLLPDSASVTGGELQHPEPADADDEMHAWEQHSDELTIPGSPDDSDAQPPSYEAIDPNDQTNAVSDRDLPDVSSSLVDDSTLAEDWTFAEEDSDSIGTTPSPPGLAFEPAGGEPHALEIERLPSVPFEPQVEPTSEWTPDEDQGEEPPSDEADEIVGIGKLLNDAQGFYTSGDRDAAGDTLLDAARAYGRIGHHESAAAIFRGLNDARQASPQVMELWLENCQVRGDDREASRVACMLGSRAMADGDASGARDWFGRAQDLDGSNSVAARQLQELDEPMRGGVATAANTTESSDVAEGDEARLGDELSSEMDTNGDAPVAEAESVESDPDDVLDDGSPPDLGWLIAEFQRGVAGQLANDGRAHYDLGVSYREMGLHDQAIASFREAARDEEHVAVATEMLVRSLLDNGRVEDAVAEVRALLGSRNLDGGARASMTFQLGLALETGGRMREALEAFEQVAAQAPDYADVRVRIEELQRKLERS